jgi:hypothetical protein
VTGYKNDKYKDIFMYKEMVERLKAKKRILGRDNIFVKYLRENIWS